MLGKFIAGDFIAIAGETRRFPASNENTGLSRQNTDLGRMGINLELFSELG